MIDIPPGKYFISHSYWDRVILKGYSRPERSTEVYDADGKTVELLDVIDHSQDLVSWLQRQIRDGVELFLFPAVDMSSSLELVSNQLIGAILACDGLIVFRGKASEQSAWVAFERDYALRSDMPVYNFAQNDKTLTPLDPNKQKPLLLPIYPHALGNNINRNQFRKRMDKILTFMKDRRNFDLYGSEIWKYNMRQVDAIFESGGYIVQFRAGENKMIDKLVAAYNPQVSRIIIALLEDCPLPEWAHPDLVVRLYDTTDPTEIDNRQIDYLIVRLYWLIFRNQFPDLVYE